MSVCGQGPFCGALELHRSAIDEEGVMHMAPGETVTLAPGGLHVMCVDVADPLQEGDLIPLTLVFEEAGDVSVIVDVRRRAP